MSRVGWIVVTCLLTKVVVAAEPTLPEVLSRAAEVEGQQAHISCRFRMTTTTEDLDPAGKVRGTLVRIYDVEKHGLDIPTRKKISENISGDVGLLLKAEPPQSSDRQAGMSPFHPERQGDFRFELKGRDENGHVRVSLEPKSPGAMRIVGEAVIDPETGEVLSMQGHPSKLPMFVNHLEFRFEYAKGVCGHQPSLAEATGDGGIMFIKSRFHSRTSFTGQTVIQNPPSPSGTSRP